jgi:hypothetical protein
LKKTARWRMIIRAAKRPSKGGSVPSWVRNLLIVIVLIWVLVFVASETLRPA